MASRKRERERERVTIKEFFSFLQKRLHPGRAFTRASAVEEEAGAAAAAALLPELP